MQPITCIFFGRSGAGKGTQANLLIEKLKSDPSRKVVYVETGQRFRDLIQKPTYMSSRIKEVMAAGKFLPPFIPIWMWTSLLMDEFTGSEHLIFDGVTRQPEEGPVLDSAINFLGRTPTVILLDISPEEARKRLLKRGRYDDKDEKITERLKAFETGAMPSILHCKASKTCNFISVNGEQSIEAVHADVVKALGI